MWLFCRPEGNRPRAEAIEQLNFPKRRSPRRNEQRSSLHLTTMIETPIRRSVNLGSKAGMVVEPV
jgi:hypothetical protein